MFCFQTSFPESEALAIDLETLPDLLVRLNEPYVLPGPLPVPLSVS